MSKNYYSILGVRESATDRELKRAYRQMALKYHPDKNGEPGAEDHFKEIAEAYDVLGDRKRTCMHAYNSLHAYLASTEMSWIRHAVVCA